MDRRDFLTAGGATLAAVASQGLGAATPATPGTGGAPTRLTYFDYRDVTLRPSRFLDQVRHTREAYYTMSDDDILYGMRRAAGTVAPQGRELKGWAAGTRASAFGQWISGMARMGRALNDAAIRDKAIGLATEWEKIYLPNGTPNLTGFTTYKFDKTLGGLIDVAVYADQPRFLDTAAKITRWATAHLDRTRTPASLTDRDGRRPNGTLEWYTLAENPLRAYQLTGNREFLEFGRLWDYPAFWGQFENTSRPKDVAARHAYSHTNSFSSAAMFYAATGDPRYLAIIRNAYDWIRGTQTYASGGFGPGEWSVAADGSLGSSLETRSDNAEIPCGSWAGFKLSRYLTGFTGEARYGDWTETLLHNAIGAALPIQPDGRTYYHADYRVGMGMKTYFWDEWPCCSGTYIQAIADYHNILYQRDVDGLYVSQIMPSEVSWEQRGTPVTLIMDTRYPDEEEARMTLQLPRAAVFALRVRIPSWARGAALEVNGQAVPVSGGPDQWAVVRRRWQDGDVMTVRLPMAPRLAPIDVQHPNRVAVMYGPVMMAQDARYQTPVNGPSHQAVLASLQRNPQAERITLKWTAPTPPGRPVADLTPLHVFGERQPYRAYFDIDRPRLL